MTSFALFAAFGPAARTGMGQGRKGKEKTVWKSITNITLKGVALAMGVAVIVMSTLKTLDVTAGVSMLGLGLAALALAEMPK